MQKGVEQERVQRSVQAASILHSDGDAMDIAVVDGRIVGVRGRAADPVNRGRLEPKNPFQPAGERLTRPTEAAARPQGTAPRGVRLGHRDAARRHPFAQSAQAPRPVGLVPTDNGRCKTLTVTQPPPCMRANDSLAYAARMATRDDLHRMVEQLSPETWDEAAAALRQYVPGDSAEPSHPRPVGVRTETPADLSTLIDDSCTPF